MASSNTTPGGNRWSDHEKSQVYVQLINQAIESGWKPNYETINTGSRTRKALIHLVTSVKKEAADIKVNGVSTVSAGGLAGLPSTPARRRTTTGGTPASRKRRAAKSAEKVSDDDSDVGADLSLGSPAKRARGTPAGKKKTTAKTAVKNEADDDSSTEESVVKGPSASAAAIKMEEDGDMDSDDTDEDVKKPIEA